MFWKPICVILNRASFTWLLYCLTKVELTSVWSSVATMFVLISGYLGIWMDMICVAFWKITVVLCSHMSLQRQEYLVFLMAQRKQWKTQNSKCVESCWPVLDPRKVWNFFNNFAAITPMKQWGSRLEARVWKFDNVHYDTMYQNFPGIRSQSFVQFPSYATNSKCQVWSLTVRFTSFSRNSCKLIEERLQSLPCTNFWTLTSCRGIFAHGVSSASRSNWKASKSYTLCTKTWWHLLEEVSRWI